MVRRPSFSKLLAGLLGYCLSGCITTPASETGWSGRARELEPGSCGPLSKPVWKTLTLADEMRPGLGHEQKPLVLIEDAEDGDTRVLQHQGRGGYWFSFVDSSGSTI